MRSAEGKKKHPYKVNFLKLSKSLYQFKKKTDIGNIAAVETFFFYKLSALSFYFNLKNGFQLQDYTSLLETISYQF